MTLNYRIVGVLGCVLVLVGAVLAPLYDLFIVEAATPITLAGQVFMGFLGMAMLGAPAPDVPMGGGAAFAGPSFGDVFIPGMLLALAIIVLVLVAGVFAGLGRWKRATVLSGIALALFVVNQVVMMAGISAHLRATDEFLSGLTFFGNGTEMPAPQILLGFWVLLAIMIATTAFNAYAWRGGERGGSEEQVAESS